MHTTYNINIIALVPSIPNRNLTTLIFNINDTKYASRFFVNFFITCLISQNQ